MEQAKPNMQMLDAPLDPCVLRPFLGAGIGRMSGVDCDERATTMTPREAITVLLTMLKPLPDIDTVALTHPERLEMLVDQHAALMALRAIAGFQNPPL
jgi:hypothetical protein